MGKGICRIHPKDNRSHLRLLDGHSTHIYNLEFLELMKANDVHPFVFPAHTTHWLQPADKALFRSLKAHWTNQGIVAVNRSGGKSLGKHGFFSIFTPAWTAACVAETAQDGFRGCGVFPVNRNDVPASAYVPSETSERHEVGYLNNTVGLFVGLPIFCVVFVRKPYEKEIGLMCLMFSEFLFKCCCNNSR